MRGKNSEGSFDDTVDDWVQNTVMGGVEDFGSLVSALPGVYPRHVREALRRLAEKKRVSARAVEKMLAQAANERPWRRRTLFRSELPVPHPLDYEWQYADAAIERLLDESAALARPPGRLVLLGAPSLVPGALRQNPKGEVMALDKNAALVTALGRAWPRARVILCDLMRERLPAIPKAAVVIADPPWYSEHIHSFLWASCQMCRPDGFVLMSLPPLGTRPGIASERARFLTLADELRLRLVRLDEGVLPYLSPPFEQNALRADGTPGVPIDWRRGDLVVFARTTAAQRPRPVPPPVEEAWCEAEVLGVRVRLRSQPEAGFVDPRLVSLVAGDILPTVSRRDPRRRSVDVWTSGNRVFHCRGTNILLQVLEALGTGQAPIERVACALGHKLEPDEADLVNRACEQASNLIGVEQDERRSWSERCWGDGLSAIAV